MCCASEKSRTSLIEPRAIEKFLRTKVVSAPRTQGNLSTEAISKLLDTCADELKELALTKRVGKLLCRPLYSSAGWTEGISSKWSKRSPYNENSTRNLKPLGNGKPTLSRPTTASRSDKPMANIKI